MVNFAAETHVDRSLMDAGVVHPDGRATASSCFWRRRGSHGVERFLHISTDEVYGPRFPDDPALETDPLAPANPYSASKAGGEQMCHGLLPHLRPAGDGLPQPQQHRAVPAPGEGGAAVRDQRAATTSRCRSTARACRCATGSTWTTTARRWTCCCTKARPGEAYNVGADNERTNLEVAETILDAAGKPRSLIRFVADRTSHDARYSMDTTKLRALGWQPRHDFEAAMEKTVAWYRDNRVVVGADQVRRDYAAYYQQQYTASGWRNHAASQASKASSASHTASTSASLSCGCIGRLRISLQTRSVTGRPPGAVAMRPA